MLQKLNKSYNQKIYPIKNILYDKSKFYIDTLGIFQSSGFFKWEAMTNHITIHIIKKGEGTFKVGKDKIYNVKKGEIFIFFPNEYIKYNDYPETPWNYTWFPLRGELVLDILKNIGISPENRIINIESNKNFNSWLARLEAAVITQKTSTYFSNLKAWEFLEQINLKETKQNKTANIANSCKSIIENELEELPTVDELAQRFKINRVTLYRIFMEILIFRPKNTLIISDLKKPVAY